MKVRITRTQYDILEHRLSIPDCIAEALNDNGNPDHAKGGDVESEAHDLSEAARRGFVDVAKLSELGKEVLWDSLDGSTFLGMEEDNVSDRKWQGLNRSFDNLCDKFEAAGLPKIGR